MRTTVTLDPDVAVQLEKEMRKEGIGFKEALNGALRRGLAAPPRRSRRKLRLKVFDTGAARVPFDDVAAALAHGEGDDFR